MDNPDFRTSDDQQNDKGRWATIICRVNKYSRNTIKNKKKWLTVELILIPEPLN